MNNSDERDYEEEEVNRRLLTEDAIIGDEPDSTGAVSRAEILREPDDSYYFYPDYSFLTDSDRYYYDYDWDDELLGGWYYG